MKKTPEDIGQLQSLVVPKIVDKWDSIAIQLEFKPVEIDNIKRNHQPHPVEEACEKMLWGWRKTSDNAQDLIKAVNDVGYARHADDFKKGLKLSWLSNNAVFATVIFSNATSNYALSLQVALSKRFYTQKQELDLYSLLCRSLVGYQLLQFIVMNYNGMYYTLK